MTAAAFDFTPLLPAGLPPPAAKWTGLAKYSFVGGNIDPEQVPLDGLIEGVNAVLRREGRNLGPIISLTARRATSPCASFSLRN